MEPLRTDTSHDPAEPAHKYTYRSAVLTATVVQKKNWSRPLPLSPHLTNSKPSGAITKISSAHLTLAGVHTHSHGERGGARSANVSQLGGGGRSNDLKRESYWERMPLGGHKSNFSCGTDLIFFLSGVNTKNQIFANQIWVPFICGRQPLIRDHVTRVLHLMGHHPF